MAWWQRKKKEKRPKVRKVEDLPICPKCHKHKLLTRHHVLPQRWFKGAGKILLLCRACHDEIEKLIDKAEGQPRKRLLGSAYELLASRFMRN